MSESKRKIGLVLGSGGARGLSHLGVAEVLAEKAISPDIIVGTSIGSIVGAALAAGTLDKVLRFLADSGVSGTAGLFFEVGVHRDGLIQGTKVMKCLGELIPDCRIEDLPVAFAAVATDISTGETVVISKGSLLKAVRASISIPGLFTPVKSGARMLVDGGVSSPVPVDTARAMGADVVIAVNVDNDSVCPYRTLPETGIQKAVSRAKEASSAIKAKIPERLLKAGIFREGAAADIGVLEILLKTVRFCENRIAAFEIAASRPDYLIEPQVGDIGTLNFARKDDAVRAGREAAEKALADYQGA